MTISATVGMDSGWKRVSSSLESTWHLGLSVGWKSIVELCEPVYKYNILERVIVENIIPRNVIINRGAAEVDNHILRDDFFDCHPLKNVIFILLYRTLFHIFFYPFFL